MAASGSSSGDAGWGSYGVTDNDGSLTFEVPSAGADRADFDF